MNTFKLVIASPDGNIFDGDAYKLDLRSSEGEFAVMAGHVPFVTSVVKGDCALWIDEDTKKDAKSMGGLLTVGKDKTTFICSTFEFK